MKTKARAKINKLLRLVEHTSLGREGFVKVSSNTSLEHLQTVVRVAYMLKKQGFLIYSEVKFKNSKGRCDLLAFSPEGEGHIIEVLHTETKEKFNEKMNKYPIEFNLVGLSSQTNLEVFSL
jgi:hypothetical protein